MLIFSFSFAFHLRTRFLQFHRVECDFKLDLNVSWIYDLKLGFMVWGCWWFMIWGCWWFMIYGFVGMMCFHPKVFVFSFDKWKGDFITRKGTIKNNKFYWNKFTLFELFFSVWKSKFQPYYQIRKVKKKTFFWTIFWKKRKAKQATPLTTSKHHQQQQNTTNNNNKTSLTTSKHH